ncbi:MAG: DUF45 domain-containing protein [Alphaproteobacteria bacterium]|nr:DUF45 domain-containing protein [Alphaproteobacteria bacterium]
MRVLRAMILNLLQKNKKKKAKKPSADKKRPRATIPAVIGGLRVKPSARAHYLNLRLDARTSEIVLTWPLRRRVSLSKAERFIAENREWIARQQRDLPKARVFAPGSKLRVAGREYVIEHAPGRGITRFEGGRLIVHGGREHLPRRVRDFLKQEALRIMKALADEKAEMLGLRSSEVRILDPKTRWGSCGPDGKIMFSWRLILAPPEVMDYLVAHEVAHRIHMNHSNRFWKLCGQLTENVADCRRWLHENGKELMVWN